MINNTEANDARFRKGGIYDRGYGIVSKRVMQDSTLSVGARMLYAYLCSYMGNGNSCYPTQKKICFDLGIAKNTLLNYIRDLTSKGYLRTEKTRSEGYRHNVYILIEEPALFEPGTEKPGIEKLGIENIDTNNNIKK